MMKKIFYLCRFELKELKKTIVITAIILTVFLASFLGVFSVNTDIMRNLCNYLNSLKSSFHITVNNGTLGEIESDYADRLIIAHDDMFGRSNLECENGKVFEMQRKIANGNGDISTYMFQGLVVFPNEILIEILKENNQGLSGRWIQNSYEICISRYIANELEARIGDKITIENYQFNLVGIYDWEDNTDLKYGLSGAHILSVGDDVELDSIDVSFSSAEDMFRAYRALTAKKLNVNVEYWSYYENVTETQAVFSAVSAILFIITIVTLYSLVSVLFRQRKAHICRLKILGATDRVVTGVYCGLVSLLLFIVTALSVVLGSAFNIYFMGLCEQLLGFTFTSIFNVYLPMVMFFVLETIVFLIWSLVNRKTRSTVLAREIRYE